MPRNPKSRDHVSVIAFWKKIPPVLDAFDKNSYLQQYCHYVNQFLTVANDPPSM